MRLIGSSIKYCFKCQVRSNEPRKRKVGKATKTHQASSSVSLKSSAGSSFNVGSASQKSLNSSEQRKNPLQFASSSFKKRISSMPAKMQNRSFSRGAVNSLSSSESGMHSHKQRSDHSQLKNEIRDMKFSDLQKLDHNQY